MTSTLPNKKSKTRKTKRLGKVKLNQNTEELQLNSNGKKVENISEINFRTATDYLWGLFNQLL